MKTFKSLLKIALAITAFFLYSCEKEQFDSNQSSITNDINKVETIYQEGDIKIETSASESDKEKLRQELEKSFTKQTTYLKSAGNLVGVIRSGGSCGSNQELYWHMDCEDSGNQSSKSGWIGDCDVNSSGNVIFNFCVVNGAFFQRTNVSYAVLNLYGTANWPYGVSRIWGYMDNENNNNKNSDSKTSVHQAGIKGDCALWDNTLLGLYYYPQQSSATPFPNLNISYGVFGQFGSNKGNIYSDDEDGGDSFVTIWDFNYSTGTLGSAYNTYLPIIAEVGANTRIYFSKVK
jgi:hypothetical protein